MPPAFYQYTTSRNYEKYWTAENDHMEITWLGHSSTRIVSGDVVLLNDPFPDVAAPSEVHIVVVTNDGPLHSAYGSIGDEPHLIDGPGMYEVLGYNIAGIGTALSDEEGSRRINTVYVIRSDGVSVCYLGSLGVKLSARQLDSLGSIDVLIASVEQRGEVGPREITRLVNVLGPRIVIPVGEDRVGEEGDQDEETPLGALLRQMNVERPDPVLRLNVTRNNLPRETRVVLLQTPSVRRAR